MKRKREDSPEYWEDLMKNLQNLNFDVGGIVLDYLKVFVKKKEVCQEFHENLFDNYFHKMKGKFSKKKITEYCMQHKNFNSMRGLLPIKIGASKERLFVPWMTPIDRMHSPKYYIAGILGTNDKESIRFRAPYHILETICESYGWSKPKSIESWSGEERNIRALMNLESDIIEV
tara:strand:- start:3117 stop:3638 length:522 start_codon:yes stop_codon:yes gene_type:complete